MLRWSNLSSSQKSNPGGRRMDNKVTEGDEHSIEFLVLHSSNKGQNPNLNDVVQSTQTRIDSMEVKIWRRFFLEWRRIWRVTSDKYLTWFKSWCVSSFSFSFFFQFKNFRQRCNRELWEWWGQKLYVNPLYHWKKKKPTPEISMNVIDGLIYDLMGCLWNYEHQHLQLPQPRPHRRGDLLSPASAPVLS